MILRHAKGTVWLKVLIHRVVVFFTLEGQYEAWVFSYHMKDPTQAERQKTQAERKRERGREEKKDMEVHYKQLLPSALCVVQMGSTAKKAHLIHRWQPNPRQMSKGLT